MKFFTFTQNNSGGSFNFDPNIFIHYLDGTIVAVPNAKTEP